MTVDTTGSSKDLANAEDLETGLDDFDATDAAVPRLSIVHKEAVFKDSMSGETFTEMKVIILGLIKQRVLWHETVDDGDVPMCKSTDHDTGYPNVSEDTKRAKRFPWDAAGFDPTDYPINAELGWAELPCDGCSLKDWGSHPDGKRPYCSEQFTLAVLYDPSGNDEWVPAVISFQKTGIKPTKTYLGSFARSRKAAYTVYTNMGLTQLSRGQTDYCVPTFTKGEETDEDEYRMHSQNYRSIREFLHAPPRPPESDSDTDEDEEEKKPAKKAPAKKAAAPAKVEPKDEPEEVEPEPKVEPTAEAETSGDDEDEDDLPF